MRMAVCVGVVGRASEPKGSNGADVVIISSVVDGAPSAQAGLLTGDLSSPFRALSFVRRGGAGAGGRARALPGVGGPRAS